MSFYLQDSGSVVWLLGVTTQGQWTLDTAPGASPSPTIVVQDNTGAYWQAGTTTSGQLEFTSVGAAATTTVVLIDNNRIDWILTATTLGQPLLTPGQYIGPVAYSGADEGFYWGGGETY